MITRLSSAEPTPSGDAAPSPADARGGGAASVCRGTIG